MSFNLTPQGCCYGKEKELEGVPHCFYGSTSYQDWYMFGYGHCMLHTHDVLMRYIVMCVMHCVGYTDTLKHFTKVT